MNPRFRSRALGLALAACLASTADALAQAPTLPPESVPLTDLRAFRAPPPSWRIVGGATTAGTREAAVEATPGTGVLLNLPSEGRGGDLYTAWRHGDLDLELDFMMPKGSNSGIYLQSRYELQLYDSWGVERPGLHDMGAIYERWDESRPEGAKGYQGTAPLLNASRAPGLWQHLSVRFRAPRFDARGRKVENARFERVVLNGVVIQENVEVTGPTRGGAEGEVPLAPLRIQGDHGAIAFRNVQVKRYGTDRARLTGLRFRAYGGGPTDLDALAPAALIREGESEALVPDVAGVPDGYAVVYEGSLELPAKGTYLFSTSLGWIGDDPGLADMKVGGARLLIDGRPVLVHPGTGPEESATAELAAGRHAFSLAYFKNLSWVNRRDVTLFVEGPGLRRQALHDTSVPPPPPPPAITVRAGREAVALRGFVPYPGGKRTHAISVADPAGVNYSYDLDQGALLQAWRGPFVETTQMWHERGNDQVAVPLGSVLLLSGAPSVAALPGGQAAWPDSVAGSGFRFQAYALDDAGRPTFEYRLGDAHITDRLTPLADGAGLQREIRVRGAGDGLYVRIGEGKGVRKLGDGSYAVDDARYYVVPAPGAAPVVREHAGRQEILVPVRAQGGEATVTYGIIW